MGSPMLCCAQIIGLGSNPSQICWNDNGTFVVCVPGSPILPLFFCPLAAVLTPLFIRVSPAITVRETEEQGLQFPCSTKQVQYLTC